MAMMMSIALRFVPTLLEETDKIMKAQSSRGADYDTGGLIARARGLVSVLIPLFVSAFKRAEDLAVAMEARCYRGGESRTRLRVDEIPDPGCPVRNRNQPVFAGHPEFALQASLNPG